MTNDPPKDGSTVGAQDPPFGIAPPGYRLPAGLRLGPVVLQVADLQRSLAFYGDRLGLRVLERSATSASLGAHADEGPLVVIREKAVAVPVPPGGRLGLYHFAILLPARAALGRLIQHLGRAGVRVAAADHRVSEAIYLSDPDGLGIEVYADRPRSTWRRFGRELMISNDPLAIEDLLRQAGHGPWSGMPAGTAIGHVHLHVGDIRQGAAFFSDALGFDRITWSYPGALFLAAGGYHHHLGTNTWAAGAAPAGDADAKLLEWTIELPDAESVAAAGRSLAEAGYPSETVADGQIVTRDPWGTAIRICAHHDSSVKA
jgi:catechol 2,3-dioxygenase